MGERTRRGEATRGRATGSARRRASGPAARPGATDRRPTRGRRPARDWHRDEGGSSDSSYVASPRTVPDRWYAPAMDAHELADVIARRVASGRPYLEFIT